MADAMALSPKRVTLSWVSRGCEAGEQTSGTSQSLALSHWTVSVSRDMFSYM